MIIKKLSIDNFGTLSDFVVDFSKGLNLIYAPNESGKSTLLSFVKFVFYGTRIKKSKDDLSFKEKYMPWNGMPMSGSVEFEHNKKDYVIYRSEGMKNGGKVCSIKDPFTGEDYTGINNAGKYFFGVEGGAFSDSCFVQNIVPSGNGAEFVCSFSDLNYDEKTYSHAKEYLEEKIRIMTSAKRKESELSLIAARRTKIMSEYMQNEKLAVELEKSEQEREKSQNRLNLLCNEIDDFNEQKKMMDYYDEYERHKKLKEYVKIEQKNNAILKEKIQSENSALSKKSSFSYRFLKYLLALFPMLLIAVFAMYLTNLLTGFGIIASVFLIIVAAVSLSAVKNKNTDLSVGVNKDVENAIKAQISYSDIRINEAISEIEHFEKSEKIELYKTMSKHFDINCFTNEEINDIIYTKSKEKERLISEIARLDAERERYVSLKQKADFLHNELCALDHEEREVFQKAEICKLALEILEVSFSKLKNNFIPRVSSRAFEIYSLVAQNDSSAIYTDEKFAALVKIKNEFKDANHLSTASRDLLYISLRIALCDMLTDNGSMPMFFDDVCASFDDVRAERLMNVFLALSSQRQIFFAACRKREKMYLINFENVNVINMGKDEING